MCIDNLSIDQLLELNQYICQRIDELQEQETLQALSQLRVGLKVTFEIREGLVLGDGGWKQYKVSLDLLRPLRDFCAVFQVYARFKVEVSNKRGAYKPCDRLMRSALVLSFRLSVGRRSSVVKEVSRCLTAI